MAEASDFKFGTQLGFVKSNHTQRKKWGWPWARASDFKFGVQLGFAKAHHKITRRRKDGRGPELGGCPKFWGFPSIFTQWLKPATSNFVHSLGLPKPIIKSYTEEKVDVVLYYRRSPKFWGSPLIFVQWLKLATSNLASAGVRQGAP